ncbi:MAG: hypothetical protein ACXU86_17025 [Archangium sp.]
MAKHQLFISKEIDGFFPVRSEAGQLKKTCTLVVNWKGTWEPGDHPELSLVVAPGDELEVVLSSNKHQGGSLWLFQRVVPLLLPTNETVSQGAWERVDVEDEGGSKVLQVNPSLAGDSGESRHGLRISALRQWPVPIVGQGDPGSLTASKP